MQKREIDSVHCTAIASTSINSTMAKYQVKWGMLATGESQRHLDATSS